MSVLASLIDAYRIPPERIMFWDHTHGRRNQGVGTDSISLLAEHATQRGWIGVLTHWQLYYRPDPASTVPGDLYFLNDVVGSFFTLSKNNSAILNLNEIRQLSNPWGSDLSPTNGSAFYMSEFGGSRTHWRLTFSIGAGLPADEFELAGRIIGFDFPIEFLERSEIPGTLEEQKLGRRLIKPQP